MQSSGLVDKDVSWTKYTERSRHK